LLPSIYDKYITMRAYSVGQKFTPFLFFCTNFVKTSFSSVIFGKEIT